MKNFGNNLDWQMGPKDKDALQREFLEIHTKLGDASLPFEIRGKKEKRKDEIIKEYRQKFGKHISLPRLHI